MSVRCKFSCMNKVDNPDGVEVTFAPVTSGSEENEKFFKYTPWGELKFGTINKAAADQFEIGAEYYLDLTPTAA